LTASTTINATGNITGGNLTTTGITSTGSLTASTTINATGNVTGGNVSAGSGIISTTGNVNGGNVNATSGITAGTTVIAVGNVTGGNIFTAGLVSATGNIAGNFILGNGSQLTGITTNYSNANVAAFLPTYSGNITAGDVSAAGNIEASGVLTAGVLFVTSGTIGLPVGETTANLFNARATTINIGGLANNIFIANVNSTTHVAGNLTAGGTVSATGNITGNFILGNGSQLTGIVSGGPAFMAYVTTGQNLSTTGAITQLSLIFDTVEREDPANLYNESTGIFQPDVPGYYQINAGTAIGTTNPSPTLTDVYYSLVVYKNTSPVVSGSIQSPVSFGGTYFLPESNASTLIYLNGTTDYVQCVLVYFVGTSVWTTTTNAIPNYFQAVWTHE
jgi:hypothetical protein